MYIICSSSPQGAVLLSLTLLFRQATVGRRSRWSLVQEDLILPEPRRGYLVFERSEMSPMLWKGDNAFGARSSLKDLPIV